MLKRSAAWSVVLAFLPVLALAEAPQAPATRPARKPADYASCSSLCQVRQPFETAAKAVSDMGYKYVDLSCLNWAPSPPHANVAELMKDFDTEASRIERILAANRLSVSNLTFDGIDAKHFEEYTRRFETVIRLAVRLKAPLVNIMAPPRGTDKQEMAQKLAVIQKIAAGRQVKLTLETHSGQLTEYPADAAWFCKQVPGLGLTLDPSHYYAGPHQGRNFDEVYPYVLGTGFRAGGMEWATVQMPWGEGPIDFAAIVRRLEAGGYKGFYVAEYIEGHNKLDAVEESKKFLAWIRTLE